MVRVRKGTAVARIAMGPVDFNLYSIKQYPCKIVWYMCHFDFNFAIVKFLFQVCFQDRRIPIILCYFFPPSLPHNAQGAEMAQSQIMPPDLRMFRLLKKTVRSQE